MLTPDDDKPGHSGLFPPTAWSSLREAQGTDESDVIRGLERLASAYWRPLYVFSRKRGQLHEAAADSVQGFFEYLLTGDVLRQVRPGEGRFRNFLLVVFRRWLDDGWRRESAAKRGGGVTSLPLHELEAAGLDLARADGDTAEEAFDRKWALSLVRRALAALSEEWSAKPSLFQALKCGLEATAAPEPYAAIAERLGITEGAVKTAAYELRRAFAVQVRREVRATVAVDGDVEEELGYLVKLLAR